MRQKRISCGLSPLYRWSNTEPPWAQACQEGLETPSKLPDAEKPCLRFLKPWLKQSNLKHLLELRSHCAEVEGYKKRGGQHWEIFRPNVFMIATKGILMMMMTRIMEWWWWWHLFWQMTTTTMMTMIVPHLPILPSERPIDRRKDQSFLETLSYISYIIYMYDSV